MSNLTPFFRRSRFILLVVLCLAALTATSVFASGVPSPALATDVIGDPDAAVAGKFAVGSSSVGSKALTVSGVIDFVGTGTVHNYFSQGGGNNMQINTNVDEANAVGDASKSQWKLVLGSSLDQFSIRRSPAGGTYNEDALLWIEGSTGRVGIATVDTSNGASIPFSLGAKLDVETDSGTAVRGTSTDPYGGEGVIGAVDTSNGDGVLGVASNTVGPSNGVRAEAASTEGTGVSSLASASSGTTYAFYGQNASTSGYGAYIWATASTGTPTGVYGISSSTSGTGVRGVSSPTTGNGKGVWGQANSTTGIAVYGYAGATTGSNYGVYGWTHSTGGRGVYGYASASSGTNYGVYGQSNSGSGYGVYSYGNLYADGDFTATGYKSAIVDTQDYGWRTLYAVESPQNWFEDFGQATLASGEGVVSIDPIFAQTVNLDQPYHVFLTPRGDCGLYVAEQTPTSFTVRALTGAACDIDFDYRIIASRRDYEDLRLKPADDPVEVAASLEAPAVP